MRDIVEDNKVVGHIYPGDRILRKQSYDHLTQRVTLNESEPYIKVYTKTMFAVSKSLSGACNQLLNILITFISYEDGILQHSNGKPLTRSNIVEISGLAEKTVDKYLDTLTKQQVIGKHKTGRTVCYTANPFIFMRGKTVSKTLVKMFENSEWAKR